MPDFINTFFNIESLLQVYPLLISGFGMSLLLMLTIVPAGMVLGLLIAMIHNFNIPVVRQLLVIYIDFIRSFPPLVLLIFLYSGLPFVGIKMGEFETVVFALTANGSAFFGEIFRAGITSISKGQMEAARSLGMSYFQAMRHVILPQAIRVILPPVGNEFVALLKDSSLVSVLAVSDLTRRGREYMARTFLSLETWGMVALIYLVMTLFAARVMASLEKRASFEK